MCLYACYVFMERIYVIAMASHICAIEQRVHLATLAQARLNPRKNKQAYVFPHPYLSVVVAERGIDPSLLLKTLHRR